MLNTRYYLLLLIISTLPCCDSPLPTINIRAVIPDSSVLASENDLFEAYPDFTKKVGLPSIEEGVDSLEYRLWCHVSANIINLIRIRYSDSGWNISETMIWSHIPEYDIFDKKDTLNHLLTVVVDSTRVRELKPDISMNRFMDSLQYFNLQEAPSNLEILGSISLPNDSWRYTFEIADSRNYRIIEYNCGEVRSLSEFHQKINGLFRFLKQRLAVNFRNCNL